MTFREWYTFWYTPYGVNRIYKIGGVYQKVYQKVYRENILLENAQKVIKVIFFRVSPTKTVSCAKECVITLQTSSDHLPISWACW